MTKIQIIDLSKGAGLAICLLGLTALCLVLILWLLFYGIPGIVTGPPLVFHVQVQ